MAFLCIVFTLLSGLLNYLRHRTFVCPVVLFDIYWGLNVLLSVFGLFGMPKASDRVYLILFVGILFFNIGTLIPRIVIRRMRSRDYNYTIDFISLRIIFLIIFTYLLKFDIAVIGMMRSGIDFGIIRYYYLSKIYKSFIWGYEVAYFMRLCLIVPLLFIYILSLFTYAIVTAKFDLKLFAGAILLTIMEYFAFGDRMILFFWISCALVSYNFFKTKIIISKKVLRWIRRILIVAVISIPTVVLIRGAKITTVFRSIYTYFVGSLPFLEQRLNDFGDSTYGVASFQGIIRPVAAVLNMFGIKLDLFEKADEFLNNNQVTVIKMGSYDGKVNSFNYFINCFGFFFKDGEYIGVAVLSAGWGYFSKNIYNKYRESRNLIVIGLLIMVIYSIMIGMMDFVMVEATFACCFYYAPLVIRRLKDNSE